MIYSLPETLDREKVAKEIKAIGGSASKVNKRLIEKYRTDRIYLAVNARNLSVNVTVQRYLKEIGGYKIELK